MGEGGIECESKVQNLSTWAMATLVAVEGKIWGSCVWMEGEFYFNVNIAFEEKPLPLEEGRTGGKPHAHIAQLLLKEHTVLQSGQYKRLDSLTLIKTFYSL